MHLINTTTLQLHTVIDEEEEEYAILSHRWQDEEVLYDDMRDLSQCRKSGKAKLEAFCVEAQRCTTSRLQKFKYVWADTCCIDKRSSAELSEAINSMYKYYSIAKECIVYLFDVHVSLQDPDFEHQFRRSEWFTRCWTLQELIAPQIVNFYNSKWEQLSDKKGLCSMISEITGIRRSALSGQSLHQFSVAERMSWAAERKATRREDMAYSLMGLFDINMPMLYGEGNKAYERLQEEILRQTDDETIFAWSLPTTSESSGVSGSLLAPSPAYFRGCQYLMCTSVCQRPASFTLTNRGISIDLKLALINKAELIYLAVLNASFEGPMYAEQCVGIYLKVVRTDEHGLIEFVRLLTQDYDLWQGCLSETMGFDPNPHRVNVRHREAKLVLIPEAVYGFEDPKFDKMNLHRLFNIKSSDFSSHCIEFEWDWRPEERIFEQSEYRSHSVRTFLSSYGVACGSSCHLTVVDTDTTHRDRYHIDLGFIEKKTPVCIIASERLLQSQDLREQICDLSYPMRYDKIVWTKFNSCMDHNENKHNHFLARTPNYEILGSDGYLALRGSPYCSNVWKIPIHKRYKKLQRMWLVGNETKYDERIRSHLLISMHRFKDNNQRLYRFKFVFEDVKSDA